jgi:hypothetical protein
VDVGLLALGKSSLAEAQSHLERLAPRQEAGAAHALGPAMIVGVRERGGKASEWVGIGVLVLILVPWLVLAAGGVLAGARGIANPGLVRWPVPMLVGGALTGALAIGLVSYVAWFLPRRTIDRFECDRASLTCETPGLGSLTVRCDQVSGLRIQTGRRGRGTQGWWLRLDTGQRLYLPAGMPNAEELVWRLRAQPGILA